MDSLTSFPFQPMQGLGYEQPADNDAGSSPNANGESRFRGHVELVPNPDFSFPAAGSDTPATSVSSTSMPYWQALNQRPLSSHYSRQPSPSMAPSRRLRSSASALPAFNFNPSASSGPSHTPPHTPAATTPTSPTSPRAIGHRRGGSEFIGGDVRAGGMSVMSTSPTKGDGALPPPNPNALSLPPPLSSTTTNSSTLNSLSVTNSNAQGASPALPTGLAGWSVLGTQMPITNSTLSLLGQGSTNTNTNTATLGPPPGRRHGHRRSQALSGHDLASIIAPRDSSSQLLGGSAPVTPMNTEDRAFFPPPSRSRRALSETTVRPFIEQNDDILRPSPVAPGQQAVPRQRVTFRNTPDYIPPRPLSTISSDTETSSVSVVRSGHSARGSINSILSGVTSSPSSTPNGQSDIRTGLEHPTHEERPLSAGILDSRSSNDRLNFSEISSRPKSAQGTESGSSHAEEPRTPKRRPILWGSKDKHAKAQASGAVAIPSASSEPSLTPSDPESPLTSPGLREETTNGDAFAGGSSVHGSKSNRKERKAKSWAQSRLFRKPKDEHEGKLPVSERVPTPLPAATADETSETSEPNFDDDNTVTLITAPESALDSPTDSFHSSPYEREESPKPMIDLDAALGPYGTPQLDVNSQDRRVPPTRRSMHSLNSSYNYHRRAESAPALEPFQLSAPKKMPSFMENVFEEENEDEPDEAVSNVKTGRSVVSSVDEPMGAVYTETTVVENDLAMFNFEADPDAADDASDVAPASLTMLEPPTTPAIDDATTPVREVSPVEVVEAHEEPRASTLERSSDSTITPSMTPDPKEPEPLLAMSPPPGPRSIATPDTPGGSTFSGPDFGHLPGFEASRLGTANSSITDHRPFFHEHGTRSSVDDVPSLTSSISETSPRYIWQRPASAITHDAQRSTSVYSGNSFVERTRHRASIASMSLLGRNRSRLNIESRPQSQHIVSTTTPAKRDKRDKRQSWLSKLLKPKKKGTEQDAAATS